MKKVFESKLTIRFSGDPIDPAPLTRQFNFASAHGIQGIVELRDMERISEDEILCTVTILTDRKRMFPDFEAYLACIQSVISHQCKTSLKGFTNISTKVLRTPDQLEEITKIGPYLIAKDLDGEYYQLRPGALQSEIQIYASEREALESAQRMA